LSSKYEIIHVLRTFRPTVPPGANPQSFQVYEIGSHYRALSQHFAKPGGYEAMTMERLRGILTEGAKQDEQPEEEETNALMPGGDNADAKRKKLYKKKKETKNTIRRALLNGAAQYGAQLVEEVIRASRVDANLLINQLPTEGNSLFDITDSRKLLDSYLPPPAVHSRR
jgi:hypothetical protein